MNSREIAPLGPQHREAFTDLISRAFFQDPLFVHLLGGPEAHEKRQTLVRFLFDKSHLMSEEALGIFDEGQLLAACLLATPESRTTPTPALLWRMVPLLWKLSPAALQGLNRYMQITLKHAPQKPHHYLVLVGVHPDHQGKGLGKTLVQHALGRVQQHPHSAGLALDTENRENVHLYQHLGFRVQAEPSLNGLPMYCMFHPREGI